METSHPLSACLTTSVAGPSQCQLTKHGAHVSEIGWFVISVEFTIL